MNGGFWVELGTPVPVAQSKYEAPGGSRNASGDNSEFSLELSSILASASTQVLASGKRGTAQRGNGCCCHETQMDRYHEASLENEESVPELEESKGEGGGAEGPGDVSVLLLHATQCICGTQDSAGFLSARDGGTEAATGIGVGGSIDEVQEPTGDTGSFGTVWQKGIRASLPPVENSATWREQRVSELTQTHGDADLQDEVEGVGAKRVTGEEDILFELLMEPSAEGSALPVESQGESLVDPYDKAHVRLRATTSEAITMHETAGEAGNEGDSPRNKGDSVVSCDNANRRIHADNRSPYHGATDKTEHEGAPVFSLSLEHVQHEEEHGSVRQGNLNSEGVRKPKDQRGAEHADNDSRLLFPQEIPVPAEDRGYTVVSYVDEDEAYGVQGERKMPDVSKEVTKVSGDRHKRTGDDKTRPVKGVGKSRFASTFASPAEISHGNYEGVSSKDRAGNPDGNYVQLNQKALRSSMIRQIVSRAELRLGREQAEMVIDLKPDVLGRVHLRISQEASKVVAEIRAENASTKALIESGLSDLKTALSEKGFSFDAVTVSWNSSRGSGGAQSGGNSLPWFSKPGEWVPDGRIAQALTQGNTVDSGDVVSAIGAFGMVKYLDYIA